MADPTPPLPGALGIVDRVGRLEVQVQSLKNPAGTQRFGAVGSIEATLEYLKALQSYGSVGGATTQTLNVAANGVTQWFYTSPTHDIPNLDIPTNQVIITASDGEASMTPAGDFMVAYVSFRVEDADGKVVVGHGGFTGRAYFNARIGIGISTGPILVTINRALYRPPFKIRLVNGIWGATGNTGNVQCVFNTPSLRAEVVGSGVFS